MATPTLFAFGSNGSGQLGIGHDEDVSIPTMCLFEAEEGKTSTDTDDPSSSSSLNPEPGSRVGGSRVSRIVAGGNHTLVLLEDGRVYAAGCNEDGRCGGSSSTSSHSLEGNLRSQPVFKRVIIRDPATGRVYDLFKVVSATWEGTFLVTSPVGRNGCDDEDDEDVVFVIGSGAKGELGLGPNHVRATVWMTIPNFPPRGTSIVSMASGMGHTVVVLSSGEVYGWGAARKGQLGESVVGGKYVWSPVRVESGVSFRVSDATCGREFTVLSGDKDVGEFVVLGSAGNKWNILSDIPAAETVKGYLKIDASWHGVYVHRRDLSVLAWGRNDRGQLPPADLQGARKMAVGSEHVVALLEDQTVVALGWGEHGNCGPDTDAQGNVKGRCSRIPLPEGHFEVTGVGAGCATSWIIAS